MGWLSRRRGAETRSQLYSISDPVLADFFSVGPRNLAGVSVNEQSALGLTAFYRAVSLISGTIASLPLRTLRDRKDGTRERVSPSLFEDPGAAVGFTQFEWIETVFLHLLVHGNAYLLHIGNGGGGLAGLFPLHPLAVTPEFEIDASGNLTGRRLFQASLPNGRRTTYTQDQLTHIPALSTDGLRGYSLIWLLRNSLGTSIAGDQAAARLFGQGALISGLVSADEDVTEEEGKVIKESLDAKIAGIENAGEIAFVNRSLKFTPWTMTNEDAQWLQSRQFQVEEVSRISGVPPHLLMQTEKTTSWGTGIEEQNRALARTVLMPWAKRVEQRLSRLVPRGQFVEFDFAGLERPNIETEVDLLVKQVQAGLMTVNEARRIRNMDPVEGGDTLLLPGGVTDSSIPAAVTP